MKQLYLPIATLLFAIPAMCQVDISTFKVVDYHVHIYSKTILDNITAQGHDFSKGGFEVVKKKKAYSDIEAIMRDNDNAKMLLLSAGYGYAGGGAKKGAAERGVVQQENELLAKLVGRYPDQLIGFYGLNPLRNYALEEVTRCKRRLGLHGLKLHFEGNNIDLWNPKHLTKLQTLFQFLSVENIPVLIHNNARDNESGTAYAERFIEFFLEKTGPLTIIFAHSGGGGGFTNFTYDFLTTFAEYLTSARSAEKHRIFFELSGTALSFDYPGSKSLSSLSRLIETIGPDHFLFGSDYPFRKSKTYASQLGELLTLDSKTLKGIIERDIFEELKQKSVNSDQ